MVYGHGDDEEAGAWRINFCLWQQDIPGATDLTVEAGDAAVSVWMPFLLKDEQSRMLKRSRNRREGVSRLRDFVPNFFFSGTRERGQAKQTEEARLKGLRRFPLVLDSKAYLFMSST